jgi:hypothetical protein
MHRTGTRSERRLVAVVTRINGVNAQVVDGDWYEKAKGLNHVETESERSSTPGDLGLR